VQNGQYLLEVHTTDGKGGDETVVKQVSVDDRNSSAGAGKVTAWPNVLKGGAASMGTTFHTNSSMNLTLRVSIYTVAGELVRTVQGDPGTNQASWDATGLASGVYFTVMELSDPKGISLGRQTVKILVLH
jgi:hypothetical protein